MVRSPTTQAEEVAACLPFKNDTSNCQYSLFHCGLKPHVAQYRPYGCLCYVKLIVPVGKVNKEDEQAVRCIHLCRARDQIGYYCLDPKSGRIYCSPHVRFVEDEFPGLTLTSHGNEKVIPSFSDEYDPDARLTKHPVDGEKWDPVLPWKVVDGKEVPYSGDGDLDGAPDGDSSSDEEPPPSAKPYSGPPKGKRVADRLRDGPKPDYRELDAAATEATPSPAIVYHRDHVPTAPFIILLGSGVRRKGDIPSYAARLWRHYGRVSG